MSVELCKDADDLIDSEIDAKELGIGVVAAGVVHIDLVIVVVDHVDLVIVDLVIVDRVHYNVGAYGMRLYEFKFLRAVL